MVNQDGVWLLDGPTFWKHPRRPCGHNGSHDRREIFKDGTENVTAFFRTRGISDFPLFLPLASCASGDAKENVRAAAHCFWGATEYVIVRNDLYPSSNPAVRAAVYLKHAVNAVTGAEINVNRLGRERGQHCTQGDFGRLHQPSGKHRRHPAACRRAFYYKGLRRRNKNSHCGQIRARHRSRVTVFLRKLSRLPLQDRFYGKDELTLSLGMEIVRSYMGGSAIPAGKQRRSRTYLAGRRHGRGRQTKAGAHRRTYL